MKALRVMSGLGQIATFGHVCPLSGSTQNADIRQANFMSTP